MKKKVEKLTKAERIAEYNKKVINYNRVVSQELSNRRKIKKANPDCFISIQNLNKIYGNLFQAVYDFSLDIKKNEFIVLVGPSGCGKTTTLRMIAGLEDITAGNLFIDGTYANTLPPKDRNLAMVFQSYALYPHMSIYDNMAFSLKIKSYDLPLLDEQGNQMYGIDEKALFKANLSLANLQRDLKNATKYGFEEESHDIVIKPLLEEIEKTKKRIEEISNNKIALTKERKMRKEEISAQVIKTAKVLQIEQYLNSKPKELSGGQRQRVALGRAIVKNAKLFLMDEPLSNLDAKLRVSMRSEIKKLHKTINATTIYVTHDQTEAMTMADRIVVMNQGRIQQIGTPYEIYNSPENIFVATFIGSPAMNLFDVVVKDNQIDLLEGNALKLDKTINDAITKHVENELAKISEFEKNGLKREEEKQLIVKKESLVLQICNGKYKAKYDEKGKVIDPFHNLSLNKEEQEICQTLYNNELEKLLNDKAIYESMFKNKEYKVMLGIRPEDIYLKDAAKEQSVKPSNIIKIKVNLSELLGNEYYLHANLLNKDFIFKANANKSINENEPVEVYFDMNKVYLFDTLNSKLIKW